MRKNLYTIACALAILGSSAYAQTPPDDTDQLQGLIDNATQNPQNGRYEVTIPDSPDPEIWRPWITGPIRLWRDNLTLTFEAGVVDSTNLTPTRCRLPSR